MPKKKRGADGRAARDNVRPSRSAAPRPAQPNAPASVADDSAWHAVRSPLRLQVLEAIRAAPGIDARSLSAALRTSAPRLYYHINILLRSGLIVGAERKETDGRRQTTRGPDAVVYRARAASFPDGFFTKGEHCHPRREALVRELFDNGVDRAIRGHMTGGAHVIVRREHLSAAETARVKALLAQVESILDFARARRHEESKLVPATHFVGCAFCDLDGGLPDGPLA